MNTIQVMNVLKYMSLVLLIFILLIVYELSTDGIMIAGEYRIYYLTDILDFLRDLF